MPYITQEARDKFDDANIPAHPETPGELNYLFTKIALIYIWHKGESYQVYNDIIGALEGAKLELYRRGVAPYEDLKIKENGDVE